MKLDVEFAELEALRRRMGAKLSAWKIGSPLMNPLEQLRKELEVGIAIASGEVETGPGDLLSYKGEQVVLYIKDTGASRWTLENEPEQSRRFHVADCKTLKDMREKGRFERYVVTTRTDGSFLVDWVDKESHARGETEAALKVCQNCLKALNYRGFAEVGDQKRPAKHRNQTLKDEIWRGFSVSEFLQEYATFFTSRPSRTDRNAIPNVYVSNWSKISEERRRAAGWTCSKCSVNLSARPGLLHCHHKNGVVTDNSAHNLCVLCALCHSEQPSHSHMKVRAQDRLEIQRLRREANWHSA